ncbi:GIY-YIG nuclease family protein [Candidatus Pacearchaeota archaeon]|jgi:hypothetical protein|nr:GIY-YIG nuclease family protein [Candidatus Pacearchaeota archaeon]
MGVRGYVYFVACAEPDCRKVHPFIKIGHTKKLENRLSELQTGSPVELAFVGYIRKEDPRSLERYLHKTFENAWLYGEWYRLSTGMITTLRHYNIVDDRFDEFFTELPKFEMDPVALAWKRYARELEEQLATFTGKHTISMPVINNSEDRKYERGRITRADG